MNAIVSPGTRKFFRNLTENTSWSGEKLNWKAKVVCDKCNSGWMSQIEEKHAKPVIGDLILGKQVSITKEMAKSIALFAFKTAVVMDHMNPQRTVSFFAREVLDRFRRRLELPCNIRMWMGRFGRFEHGGVFTVYHRGLAPQDLFIELYTCNYSVGHFFFQVVSERVPTFLAISPIPGYEKVAVPFWPWLPEGFCWPPGESLLEFREFGTRWKKLFISRPIGD